MTPEERAEQIHLDSICRDDFLMEDLDEVRRDIAQAIHAAELEAYDHWLGFVKTLCDGIKSAKDAVGQNVEYCTEHPEALSELKHREAGARYIYDQLLGSYDSLKDSLVPEPASS